MIDPTSYGDADVADVADLEERIAAIMSVAAFTTPQESALALAAALYAVVWADVRAEGVPEQNERSAITALLEAVVPAGAAYARTMIAEGQFRVVVA